MRVRAGVLLRDTKVSRRLAMSLIQGAALFSIRKAVAGDSDVLFEMWWQSVRGGGSLFNEADLLSLAPQIKGLSPVHRDTWVLEESSAGSVGFVILSGSKIESLCVAPAWIRLGGGDWLLHHAQSLHGDLSVDVNEQNFAMLEFYLEGGFAIVRRSHADAAGRPFPLLHLKKSAA
jgi:putative acetyltransferase